MELTLSSTPFLFSCLAFMLWSSWPCCVSSRPLTADLDGHVHARALSEASSPFLTPLADVTIQEKQIVCPDGYELRDGECRREPINAVGIVVRIIIAGFVVFFSALAVYFCIRAYKSRRVVSMRPMNTWTRNPSPYPPYPPYPPNPPNPNANPYIFGHPNPPYPVNPNQPYPYESNCEPSAVQMGIPVNHAQGVPAHHPQTPPSTQHP